MRISDWSSDVCSSDLARRGPAQWRAYLASQQLHSSVEELYRAADSPCAFAWSRERRIPCTCRPRTFLLDGLLDEHGALFEYPGHVSGVRSVFCDRAWRGSLVIGRVHVCNPVTTVRIV